MAHANEPVYDFHQGSAPLLLSMPHVGTQLPDALRSRLSATALTVPDTDWHLPILYDFARAMGASILQARMSRYVVDLNRPPDDANLYPGQDTTGLCPVDTFAREPLYLPGKGPTAQEIAERKVRYWQPYHDRLSQTLVAMRHHHDAVVLWDAHSIASVVPRFFEGQLPDLNLGTASGSSCALELAENLKDLASQSTFSTVLNGRFKGGYITRHYGNPGQGVHAVQLEMAQCTYMNEAAPFAYRQDLAEKVQPTLKSLLHACLDFAHRATP
jgi:N-formylglutamate deformylase